MVCFSGKTPKRGKTPKPLNFYVVFADDCRSPRPRAYCRKDLEMMGDFDVRGHLEFRAPN